MLLSAPPGQHDDRAMAYVLALAAAHWGVVPTGKSVIIPPVDIIAEADRGGWRWHDERGSGEEW